MATIFLTGFPGFLGSALVGRLLDRYPAEIGISCLVQGKFMELAAERAAAIVAEDPAREDRIHLVAGDITLPNLGLGPELPTLQEETVEIYHLAAVYDLGVARELAMRVNVDGTRNMLDFALGCPRLNRFQYTSTCYVSGRYPGLFGEADLSKSQAFNNYYEETKYLAEVAVQNAMKAGLPATIYRPSVVTGDSRSGATQKYDGPYYYIRLILRQPGGVALLPVVGDPQQARVNVVPRDFVIDAIAYLSGLEASSGQVYQLCDPDPLTVSGMIEAIAAATGKRIVRVPVPFSVAKGFLDHVPGIEALMEVEPESITYFMFPTTFDCYNTLRDLAGSGISCPPFTTYVDNLVEFVRDHPDISAAAMV